MVTTFNHRFHFFLTFFFHYTMFLAVIAVGRFSAKYMTSVTKCRIALAGYAALYAEADLKI